MTINASFHAPKSAGHKPLPGVKNDTLSFDGKDGEYIALFVPPHVAEHTAAAFNRAMQAVPDRDGWTYTTKSGVWHIQCPMPRVYLAQHDEITGDGDPPWMFADAPTLIGCMDAIDAVEDEHACDVCSRLVGDDNLTEHDDSLYCEDCAKTEAEHQRGMAEMAADDAAHAEMDRRAGL